MRKMPDYVETVCAASNQEITVIMPVLNEACHIEKTLRCLLALEPPSDFCLEFLLVDGGSSDGTREIISRYAKESQAITLLDNPCGKTPAALNIGLAAARGEYVCIFGAHARYPQDYIRTCWTELHDHGAVGCSGSLVTAPAGRNLGARMAAWCLRHRFASSGRSVRTLRGGYAGTIPYPIMRKSVLLKLGGYDEKLQRNQDNDMNQRICAQGHKLYLTPRTHAEYYAPGSLIGLNTYAFRTGKWNAITLRYRPAAMSLRHFMPLAFVAVLFALGFAATALTLSDVPRHLVLMAIAAVLGSHLAMGGWAGIETALQERRMAPLLLPPVILGFHLAYGAGTLAGLFIRIYKGERKGGRPGSQKKNISTSSEADLPASTFAQSGQANE